MPWSSHPEGLGRFHALPEIGTTANIIPRRLWNRLRSSFDDKRNPRATIWFTVLSTQSDSEGLMVLGGTGGGGGGFNVLTTPTRRRWRNRNGGAKTAAWRPFRRRSTLHRAVKNKRVTAQGPVKKPQLHVAQGGGGGCSKSSSEVAVSCKGEVCRWLLALSLQG